MSNQSNERPEALRILRDMHLSKSLTNTTRKALVARLIPILENEQARFEKWKEVNRFHINITRQKQVERKYIKRIQALKIVIHMLDTERWWTDDEPSFIVKRDRIKTGSKYQDDAAIQRKKIQA